MIWYYSMVWESWNPPFCNLPAALTTTMARLLLKAQETKNNGEAFLCSKSKKRKTSALPIILLKSDLRGFEFPFKSSNLEGYR
ncbi:hypothetical protein P3L10_014937 [Capsicum annuum]